MNYYPTKTRAKDQKPLSKDSGFLLPASIYRDQMMGVLSKRQEVRKGLRVCVEWLTRLFDYLYMVLYSHWVARRYQPS